MMVIHKLNKMVDRNWHILHSRVAQVENVSTVTSMLVKLAAKKQLNGKIDQLTIFEMISMLIKGNNTI